MSQRVVNYAKRNRAAWLLADPWRFCTVTGILNKLEDQPHREMLREAFACVPNFSARRQKRKLYLTPRYTYKTSIIIALIVYLVLRFPNISISVYRASRELSKEMLGTIIEILTTNAEILATFGDVKTGASWKTTAITLNTRTEHKPDPTITARGMKTSANGTHPDIIFADDLVTEINCDSVAEMDKAENLIASFYPVLPPWGVALITGTQWSNIDVYKRLRDKNQEARDDNRRPDFEEYIRKVEFIDDNGDTQLFFPRDLTWDFLERQRESIPARWYAAWYYQETQELGMKPFPRAKIKMFSGSFTKGFYHVAQETDEEGNPLGDPFAVWPALVVDPALTAASSSDSWGAIMVAWDAKGDWWVFEAQEWRVLPSKGGEEIIKLLRDYEPKEFLIESANADAEMMARVGAFIRSTGMDCAVKSYAALQDEAQGERGKTQRILSLEPILHRIHFRRGHCGPVIRQLDSYPSVRKDDVIDALAMARKLAKKAPAMAKAIAPDDLEPTDVFHQRMAQAGEATGTDGVPRGCWTGPFSQRLRQ